MFGYNVYLFFELVLGSLKLFSIPVGVHLIVFSLLIMGHYQKFKLLSINKNLLWIIVLVFYSGISTIASPNKIQAIQNNISLCIITFYLAFVFYININHKSFESIRNALVITGIIYIVLSFLFRDILIDYKGEFHGFGKNKHNTSLLLGFYCLVFISQLIEKFCLRALILYSPMIIMTIYLQIITYSRIGFFLIGVNLIVLAAIFIIKQRALIKLMIMSIIVVLIVVTSKLETSMLIIDYISYLLERGFSGRNQINSILYEHLMENLIHFVGGCGAGCLDSTGAEILNGMTPRDSFIIVGLLFEYGLVGLIILSLFIVKYLHAIYANFIVKKKTDYLLLIPLSFVLIPSETALINFNSCTTVMMYTVMIVCLKFANKENL